ncbi:RNA polymerase sigma factor [Bacteroidales bacterium OttesenSCG-928-K03]|nr:RNA polymerase sigma factor [Bacteroidales bacterium OttesenSCG-928-K03]
MKVNNNPKVNSNVSKNILDDKRALFNYLYSEELPKIKTYILINGGSLNDAEDIFQEIMLIILKKLDKNIIDIETISAYINRIARNLWLQSFRKEKPLTHVDNMSVFSENISYEANVAFNANKDEINNRIILKHIKMLDNDNKKLFMLYYNRYKAAKIAVLMGYSGGENYVRKKIHICKSKLIKKIKNDPEFMGF